MTINKAMVLVALFIGVFILGVSSGEDYSERHTVVGRFNNVPTRGPYFGKCRTPNNLPTDKVTYCATKE